LASANPKEISQQITLYDLKRVESYANNMVDYHMIMDLLPTMARHYFLEMPRTDISLSPVQAAIIIALGLQHRTVEDLEKELQLPVSQILAMFIKTARKFSKLYRDLHLQRIEEAEAKPATPKPTPETIKEETPSTEKRSIANVDSWSPTAQGLDDDLDEAAKEARNRLREKQRELINSLDLKQYAVGGNEEDWNEELKKKGKNIGKAVLNISSKKGETSKKSLAKNIFANKDADLMKKAKKSKYARQ
jgi:N-acetyltransferase 10